MCRTCDGQGYCPACRGDGVDNGIRLRTVHDEEQAVVAFLMRRSDEDGGSAALTSAAADIRLGLHRGDAP